MSKSRIFTIVMFIIIVVSLVRAIYIEVSPRYTGLAALESTGQFVLNGIIFVTSSVILLVFWIFKLFNCIYKKTKQTNK